MLVERKYGYLMFQFMANFIGFMLQLSKIMGLKGPSRSSGSTTRPSTMGDSDPLGVDDGRRDSYVETTANTEFLALEANALPNAQAGANADITENPSNMVAVA